MFAHTLAILTLFSLFSSASDLDKVDWNQISEGCRNDSHSCKSAIEQLKDQQDKSFMKGAARALFMEPLDAKEGHKGVQELITTYLKDPEGFGSQTLRPGTTWKQYARNDKMTLFHLVKHFAIEEYDNVFDTILSLIDGSNAQAYSKSLQRPNYEDSHDDDFDVDDTVDDLMRSLENPPTVPSSPRAQSGDDLDKLLADTDNLLNELTGQTANDQTLDEEQRLQAELERLKKEYEETEASEANQSSLEKQNLQESGDSPVHVQSEMVDSKRSSSQPGQSFDDELQKLLAQAETAELNPGMDKEEPLSNQPDHQQTAQSAVGKNADEKRDSRNFGPLFDNEQAGTAELNSGQVKKKPSSAQGKKTPKKQVSAWNFGPLLHNQ